MHWNKTVKFDLKPEWKYPDLKQKKIEQLLEKEYGVNVEKCLLDTIINYKCAFGLYYKAVLSNMWLYNIYFNMKDDHMRLLKLKIINNHSW